MRTCTDTRRCVTSGSLTPTPELELKAEYARIHKDGSRPIYISGDTVWYDGVAEVAKRFKAGVVLPFAGAAQTRGPFHLTMDTNDTIETARAFPDAVIVPVHTDGWAHFRQGAGDLRASFDALGFGSRLKILEPGVATVIEPS